MFRVLILLACLFCVVDEAAGNQLYWLTEPDLDVGLLADHEAQDVRISNTGRYISFVSKANNLVMNDFNHVEDLFIKDLQTGTTQLVSVTQTGVQASEARIDVFSRPSFDGRYVAFASRAAEFPGGNGEDFRLYVKDMVTGELFNESGFGNNDMLEITGDDLYMSDNGQVIIFSSRSEIDPLHVSSQAQVYLRNRSDGSYILLSTSLDGTASANGITFTEHVSSNGRYVLMNTRADNLTADAINNSGENLILLDWLNDSRTLVNITPGGVSSSQSEFSGWTGQVSNLGTVVFTSRQTDLVPGDTNNRGDVFWYDSGTVTRINVDAMGNQLIDGGGSNAVAISGDGSRIAFTENSNDLIPADISGEYQLYGYETATGNVFLISQNGMGLKANRHSYDPQLTVLGDEVLFTTGATDLTVGPTAYGPNTSIIRHDFMTGSMQQEHVPLFTPQTVMDDILDVKISSDQMTVVFTSQSPNLVPEPLSDNLDLFVLNRSNQVMDRMVANINSYPPSLSPSGRYVTFRTLHQPPAGTTPLGGSYIYRYDRQNNAFLQIAEGLNSRVDDQGVVVFDTYENLVPNDSNGDRDVYAYNPNNGHVVLLSLDMNGDAAGTNEFDFSGEAGAGWVTFSSDNDQIVNNDNNGETDVFLRPLGNSTGTVRVSQTQSGLEGNESSFFPAISADGRWVAFITAADNLTNDDYSGADSSQVLLFDRLGGGHMLVSLNQQGVPLTAAGSTGIGKVAVSDAGRFVVYGFSDVDPDDNKSRLGHVPEFAGDTDGQSDLVLFDTMTQSRHIISRLADGTETVDDVGLDFQIRSDLASNVPTVGVVFTADHGSLTGRLGHPGHDEAYLYQQAILNLDVIFVDGFE